MQSLSEQVPLTQLFRQQSVPVVHEPPLAWQKVPLEHTEPSQVPPQHGRPVSHAAPAATHVPPSVSEFGLFPPPFTEPLQLQALMESATPKVAIAFRAKDFFIGILRTRPRRRADSPWTDHQRSAQACRDSQCGCACSLQRRSRLNAAAVAWVKMAPAQLGRDVHIFGVLEVR